MKRCLLMSILAMITLAAIPSFCAAQDTQPEPPNPRLQGSLRDHAGQIVRDSLFSMTFRFYADSLSTELLWSESHPQVATRNGMFDVTLGSVNPCSLSLFDGRSLYLETQVGNDMLPLSPRMPIGAVPRSGSSQRVAGDVFTSPGSIRMFAPQPEPPSPDPLMLMETGPGGQASIRMFAPQPEPPHPDPTNILNISSSPDDGGSIEMYAPEAEVGMLLVNRNPQIRLNCDNTRSSLLIQRSRDVVGGLADSTGVIVKADSIASSLSLFMNNSEQVKISAQINQQTPGGGINLFSNGSEYMGVGPSPFDSGGELKLYDTGGLNSIRLASTGSASFFDNGSEYMGIDPSPFNGGGILRMRDMVGLASIQLSSEGSAGFFDDGSEYMGIEPSPFHSGGSLVMSDSDGVNTIEFSSLGQASFFSGGSEFMGVDPSPFGGALNMYESGGNASIQLASDGSASFFNDGTEFMGIEPVPFGGTGGVLKMYGSIPPQSLVTLSSEGKLSLGTTNTSNILTIRQSSSTDPIADAWTVYSSRRWKTNIQPIQNALDKVMRLNGVTYDWIENGKHDIGLIAEEVGQVIPEIVAYEENGVDAKSVDYARLTALLIEGMKEQQKEIDKLKTEIEELKHKGASQ